MAYFPNGTAGMMYEEEYCFQCIHENEEHGCAVMLLHNLYNYDQCDEGPRGEAIKAMLDTLIPRTKDDLGAEQCTMFAPIDDPEAEAAEQRRLAEQPRKYAELMQARAA